MKIAGLTSKQATNKINDDLKAQAFIKEKYGKEKLEEAIVSHRGRHQQEIPFGIGLLSTPRLESF